MQYKVVMPILGFEEVEELTLEPVEGAFFQLRNKKGGAPTFTLVRPEALREDYAFEIPDAAAEKLGLKSPEEALVLNIMILAQPLEKSYVNFLAPLIFNRANGRMAQVILDETRYPSFGVAESLDNFLGKKETLCE